jgi:hypothetical protein
MEKRYCELPALITSSIEAKYCSYEHKITGHRAEDIPNETIGGILADDMGLGKTLSVLATIIRSTEAGELFASTGMANSLGCEGDDPGMIFSRATLVIVPSSGMSSIFRCPLNLLPSHLNTC